MQQCCIVYDSLKFILLIKWFSSYLFALIVIPQVMKRTLFSISGKETIPLHATLIFHARMEPPQTVVGVPHHTTGLREPVTQTWVVRSTILKILKDRGYHTPLIYQPQRTSVLPTQPHFVSVTGLGFLWLVAPIWEPCRMVPDSTIKICFFFVRSPGKDLGHWLMEQGNPVLLT